MVEVSESKSNEQSFVRRLGEYVFSPSLFARFSRWLLVLLLTVAAVQYAASLLLQQRFLQQSFQIVNADFAGLLVPELQPYFDQGVDYSGIAFQLDQFKRSAPMHSFFVLNEEGDVLLHSEDPFNCFANQVPLAPLLKFIEKAEEVRLPLYAPDPCAFAAERDSTFSVARIPLPERKSYYLFISLFSSRYERLIRALVYREGPIIAVVSFLAALLFAAASAFLLSVFIVRRIRRLQSVLSDFAAGQTEMRIEVAGRDEIAGLSESFNSMAETISTQMAQIRAQDSLRRELVQNICHDLRTPLTSAMAFTETLEMKLDHIESAERSRYLRTIYDNLVFMQGMTEELFELSNLEASERKANYENFDLVQLLEAIVEKFEEVAASKRIQIVRDGIEDACQISADVGMLSRALSNLIENAIRYTLPEGQVAISLTQSAEEITIKVRDTGVGISADELPHIFSRFYRATSGRKVHEKGSGLGLAIVQRIAELHGATIEVESELGVGSVFKVTLPVAAAS